MIAGALFALVAGRAEAVQFVDVAPQVGVVYQHAAAPVTDLQPPAAASQPTGGAAACDVDGDGWVDLVVSRLDATPLLFRNAGGTFADGTVAAGVGRERSGMGSTQDDFDGDGRIDWFATSIFGRPDEIAIGVSNQMYRNRGDRTFDIVTEAAGVADGGFGWAASSFDFDNDGDADVAHTNGMFVPGHPEELRWQTDRTRLFENRGDGAFDEVAAARGIADAEQGKALLTLDFDRDGDLDVFVANHAGAPVLYRNDGGNAGSWFQLELEGTLSNRDGIGAVVTVTLDLDDPARRQTRHHLANSNFIAQDELLVHIGLGDHAGTIDRVTIAWPSGIVQTLSDVPVRARLRVTEAESGPPCQTAEISMLETRRHGGVFDKLRWTFRGTAGPSGDAFGAPGVATRYDLAVTDPQGTLVRVTVPASATLWRTTRTGYRFADRAASSGVARMVLERRAGTVAIAIAGKGRDLGLARRAPRLPLRVRLSNDAGSCWDVTYTDGRALGPGFRARLP